MRTTCGHAILTYVLKSSVTHKVNADAPVAVVYANRMWGVYWKDDG